MSRIEDADGLLATARFSLLLDRLAAHGVIGRTLALGDEPLASFRPMTAPAPSPAPIEESTRYVLSRFAYLRRDGEALTVESPLSTCRVILHDPRASAIVVDLATPRRIDDLTQKDARLPREAIATLLAYLRAADALTSADVNGGTAEQHNDARAPWEFHDLLFHSRSRLGRHDAPFGGTYPFDGVKPPLPAVKPRMSEDTVPLDRPDLEQLCRSDMTLSAAMEGRRSLRKHGADPISKRQLGEFLYRSSRIRKVIPGDACELTDRPYPGGGAIYELETYVAVDCCSGMDAGLYHYRPMDHELSRIADRTRAVEALLANAFATIARTSRPQTLIMVAARFGRVQWKYQSMAYALILKDVGVLYQTMYLVATAMGLAPCALGGGNSDLFAAATGLDYLIEGSVGEFTLGTRE